MAESIQRAQVFEKLFPAADTLRLSLQSNVLLDVHPKVRFFSGGFVLFSEMARSIVLVSRSGEFLKSFGGNGEGPGEFRSMAAVDVDSRDNIYVFDTFLARISILSISGELLKVLTVKNPQYVRHICADGQGAVFAHHTPDSRFAGFVSMYGESGFVRCLVPPIDGYSAYYFRGHLEGGMVATSSGVVYESNAFSYKIHRVLNSRAVTDFGEEPSNYVVLPRVSRFQTIHQLQQAVSGSTIFRGLFLVHKESLLLQEALNMSSTGNRVQRRVYIYDTTGVFLGELRVDRGGIDSTNGDVLIEVCEQPVEPGTEEQEEMKTPFLIIRRMHELG